MERTGIPEFETARVGWSEGPRLCDSERCGIGLKADSLVGNARISLQANPATLAVAQSRTLGPSNSRSRKLWNSSSLHLSLSKTLGRANAQSRQVDMYTNLVPAHSRML